MLADFDRAGRRAFDRAHPARLTSLGGKGGALGTTGGDGKLVVDPQLGGDFPSAKIGRLDLDVDRLAGAAYDERWAGRITTQTAIANGRGTLAVGPLLHGRCLWNYGQGF
jgi:hypothetical protein